MSKYIWQLSIMITKQKLAAIAYNNYKVQIKELRRKSISID